MKRTVWSMLINIEHYLDMRERDSKETTHKSMSDKNALSWWVRLIFSACVVD